MNEQSIFLLVDDDPDDIMLLKDAIQSVDERVQIAEAKNGRTALAYLKEAALNDKLPNLVVLDINMPILNGIEVIALIKKEAGLHQVPLVVFSTSSNPGDLSHCNEYGIELIVKPFGMKALVDVAKTLIKKYAVQ